MSDSTSPEDKQLATTSEPEPETGTKAPEQEKKKRRFHWSVEVGVFIAIFFAIQWWQKKDVVSGEAPNVIGYDLSGEGMSLKNLRDKPTVIHFWATWCGVCDAMDSNIASLSEDYQVVTIASQSGSPGEVIKWMKDNDLWDEKTGPMLKVLVDDPGRIAQAYGVKSFPSTFFIGTDGEISFREVGYTTTLGLKARAMMTR